MLPCSLRTAWDCLQEILKLSNVSQRTFREQPSSLITTSQSGSLLLPLTNHRAPGVPGRRLGRWGLGTGGQGWLLQVVSHTGEYLSSFPGVLSTPVSSYRAGCLKASDFLFSFSPPTTSPSTIGHLSEAKWAQNAILNVGRTHYLMCPENKQGRT